jgi:hypothetical protein
VNGLAAACGVYVISLVLEDTTRTAIATLAFDRAVQSYIYQSVVWLTLAFVGSFIARRSFMPAIILFSCCYWIVRAGNFVDNFSLAAPEPPTDIELLFEIAPFALVSIASVIVGSTAGQRFGQFDSASTTDDRYVNRRRALFLLMLCLCVVGPQAYSVYWFSEAQAEVRVALDSIKDGIIPKNVEPFANDLSDRSEDVKRLLETYSGESEVRAVSKFGAGFHSYEVRILSGDEVAYHAHASFKGGGWRIDCCSQW